MTFVQNILQINILRNIRRARRLAEISDLVGTAALKARELLQCEDTLYATQDGAWQEGDAGRTSCAASETLRAAVQTLRTLPLPAAEDFG